MEITKDIYLLAKKIIEDYESKQLNIIETYNDKELNKLENIGRFTSLDKCESEAIIFTEEQLKIAGGLLSEDYKTGYKEGIEHYLAFRNNL